MIGMGTGIDPRVVYVFKRLYGEEDNALLLVSLLNAVISFPAGRPVHGVDYLNPFVARDFARDKGAVLDIKARDDPGRLFQVEMQRLQLPGLVNRLLFYWAKGHASQLTQGQRYELLQPTFSKCFLDGAMYSDAAYHHTFRLIDPEQGVPFCKDLEIHLLELAKFAVPVEQVRTPLEQWCSFLKYGASLDLESLPATLDVPPIRQAVEVLVKICQDERAREYYQERERAERDLANILEALEVAREEKKQALEERKQALEKAREEGEWMGRIRLLQQLLQQPETSREELNQMPLSDLQQLEESLKQQLAARKPSNGTPPADKT